MYSGKFLENSIKLLRNPLPVILQTFFPQSQKNTQKGYLETQSALK